jgi:hypothetical protein
MPGRLRAARLAYPPGMEDHAYAPDGEDPDSASIQIYPDEGQIYPDGAEPGWK